MGTQEGGVKHCNQCDTTKPRSEFYRKKGTHDGLRADCKSCAKASALAWNSRNRNRFNENQRKSYGKLRVKRQAKQRAYYAANAETCKAKVREYEHRNPDKVLAWGAKRRRLEKHAPGGEYNEKREDYHQRLLLYGGMCAYCMKAPKKDFDHAIPLSKGGTNFASNIYPTCWACNRGRGGKFDKKLWSEWVPPFARKAP